VHAAPDDLGGPAPVDALGGAVEEDHLAAEIRGDDAVDRRVDDTLEKVLRLDELGGDLALAGHVPERAEHDAVLAEHRAEVHVEHDDLAVGAPHPHVDALREHALREAAPELVRDPGALEEVLEAPTAEGVLLIARDVAGARVRELEVAVEIDDDDAVARALEEVGVPLEGAHAPLGLEARDGDLLRLVAERLEDARVAEGDGHGARDRAAERERPVTERVALPRPEREHAHRATFVEDGQDRDRREGELVPLAAKDLEHGVGRRVGDDERGPRRQNLLYFWVFSQIDGEVAELLVVRRGDDVAHVSLAHEHDGDAVDLGDLGDALHDREQDAAEVEVRGERLRELGHDEGVFFAARKLVLRGSEAHLPPNTRDELDGLEGLAQEVVGAGLEGARDLVVRVEGGEHHDRDVLRVLAGAQDAEDLVAVGRGHDEVEQDHVGFVPVDLPERLGAGRDRHRSDARLRERLNQDMAADVVVVDHEHGAGGHIHKV
jgi:hypothetical protein